MTYFFSRSALFIGCDICFGGSTLIVSSGSGCCISFVSGCSGCCISFVSDCCISFVGKITLFICNCISLINRYLFRQICSLIRRALCRAFCLFICIITCFDSLIGFDTYIAFDTYITFDTYTGFSKPTYLIFLLIATSCQNSKQ